MELIIIIMEQNMKDIGKMIVNMDLEHKLGSIKVNMKEIIKMEKKMVKESMFGKMEVIIMEIGKIIK